MTEPEPKSYCYGLPLLAGAVTPLLIFFAVNVAAGNYSVGRIILDAVSHFFTLLVATVTGMIPFVVLAALLYGVRNRPPRVSGLICSVGLVGVTGLAGLGNVAFWYPVCAGEHVSSTAPLIFFFVPFYGCMAAVAALVIGMAASLIPWFRHEREARAR